MQKTAIKTKKVTFVGRLTAAFVLAVLLTSTTYPGVQTASAVGSTCNSIAECTNQINAGNAAVGSLRNQAVSYKDAITRLSSQIGSVQNQIAYNQSEQARLEREIAAAKQRIAEQKLVLAEVLRSLYIDGEMSPIEALAVSDTLSDYVDKAEYKNSVSRQLQDTLNEITRQQSQLESNSQQVASLLSQQQSQAAQLRASQEEQSSMLNYNHHQQSSFTAQTAANQKKLAALIAAQRNANNSSAGGYYFLRFPGSVRSFNPSAYPYANSGFSMSTAPGCNDNDGPDKWGYCTRQCVSFAAWAVEATGRSAPRYWSDAKKWVARARASGIQVANTPQRGDIAISTRGNWGHAMYVNAVSGKTFNAWEYNQRLDGRLRTDRWVAY